MVEKLSVNVQNLVVSQDIVNVLVRGGFVVRIVNVLDVKIRRCGRVYNRMIRIRDVNVQSQNV